LIAEHLAVRTGVGLFDVSHMAKSSFAAQARWQPFSTSP